MRPFKNDVFCLLKSALTVAVLVAGASAFAEDNKGNPIVCDGWLDQGSTARPVESLKPTRMQTKIAFTLQQIVESVSKNGAMFIPAIDQLDRALQEQVANYMGRIYGSDVVISEWSQQEKKRFQDFPSHQRLRNHLFEQLENQITGLFIHDHLRHSASDGRGLRVDFFNKAGDKTSRVYAQYEQMGVMAWYPAIVKARTNRFQVPLLPFELGRKSIDKETDGLFFLIPPEKIEGSKDHNGVYVSVFFPLDSSDAQVALFNYPDQDIKIMGIEEFFKMALSWQP